MFSFIHSKDTTYPNPKLRAALRGLRDPDYVFEGTLLSYYTKANNFIGPTAYTTVQIENP